MQSGYRTIAILCFGALFLTTLGTGAFFGSLYAPDKSQYHTEPANGSQSYPSNAPKNGLADTSGIDGYAERIIAQPKPRNPQERQDRDLAAQEAVAVFSYWGFWGIVLQTLLAGGALLALLKDLTQNRKSSEMQLRAYVSVEPLFLDVEAEEFRFHFRMKNGGATPAYDCLNAGGIEILDPSDLEDFFTRQDANIKTGLAARFVLHGGGEWFGSVPSFEKFRPEEIDAVKAGTKAIYFWGIVEYTDAFGNDRETRFCFEQSGIVFKHAFSRSADNPNANIPVRFITSPYHNTAT